MQCNLGPQATVILEALSLFTDTVARKKDTEGVLFDIIERRGLSLQKNLLRTYAMSCSDRHFSRLRVVVRQPSPSSTFLRGREIKQKRT